MSEKEATAVEYGAGDVARTKRTRCVSDNMVMAESVPFGQRWTYHSEAAMQQMLDPEYFSNLSVHQLRAGDQIQVFRTKDDSIAEFAEILVVKGGINKSFYIRQAPVHLSGEVIYRDGSHG